MLDTKTPIGNFLAMATLASKKPVERTQEEELSAKISELGSQIVQLKTVKPGSFIPYEAAAMMRLTGEKIKKLEGDKRVLTQKLKNVSEQNAHQELLRQMHVEVARKGYRQQLDPTPLSGSTQNGPVFMVSPFDNPSGNCQIKIKMESERGRYRAFFTPKLPPTISNLLGRACRELAARVSGVYSEIYISASFAGYAAEQTETIIKEVKKAKNLRIFDQILVIADAPQWQINKTVERFVPPTLDDDPVIAGWVEKTRQLFFITAYNMTPNEQYFHDQFGFGVTLPEEK